MKRAGLEKGAIVYTCGGQMEQAAGAARCPRASAMEGSGVPEVKRARQERQAITWPLAIEPPLPVRGSGLGWVDWWDDAELSTAVLQRAAAERERDLAEAVGRVREQLRRMAVTKM